MLSRLITPLRARFDLSPLPTTNTEEAEDDNSPENFARDVLVELMRNAVEALKATEDVRGKVEVSRYLDLLFFSNISMQAMGEMHRIMVEDACTKDVFRELDGFLLLVNELSVLSAVVEREGRGNEASITEVIEGERLAFTLLAESFAGHSFNQHFFEVCFSFMHTYLVKNLQTDSRRV